MKKLIITADDYGMSISVNKAIEKGMEKGIITSTNVMTNMNYFKDAKNLKDKYENISVGIHWTLTAGKPVSNPKEIKTLLNNKDEFYSYKEFRSRFRKGKIKKEEIKKELNAQYDKFYKICGKPDYWNTHQNVHVDFKIYKIFVEIAKELNINKMRSHQRIYVKSSNDERTRKLKWIILEPIKRKILDIWQNNAHKNGIKSPNGILVFFNEKDTERINDIFKKIEWRNGNIGELVIHPAIDSNCKYFGKITTRRIKEYEVFSSIKTKELLGNSKILLTSFKEI